MAGTTQQSGAAGQPSSTAGSSYPPSGQAGTAGQASGSATTGSATMQEMNARVTKIERVRRSATGAGAGTVAGAAVGSSGTGAGTSASSDRVYRITVRMNDGSTRVITQESAPTFKRGARVRVENDMITQ